MELQVQDIIKDAMGLCGAIKMDEAPTVSEYLLGIRALNVMVDKWSGSTILVRSREEDTFPLVAGQSSYTIGLVGADLTADKPLRVDHAYIRDSTGNDEALVLGTKEQYDGMGDKYTEGRPELIAYDPGLSQQSEGKGTLFLYPTPDSADTYTLALTSYKYVSEFSDWTDTITFEPVYYEPLIYGLALRLFRHFHPSATAIPADIAAGAAAGILTLETLNAVQKIAYLDLPGVRGGTYNIYTDD
jgi:hypothetical protein